MKHCANKTFPAISLAISGLLLLAACSSNTLTIGSYDGATGKTSKTTYSKFYDNGGWLLKDKLGLVILVNHDKKVIPIAHATAKTIGALVANDSFANGKLSLSVWNFDSVPHQVKFKKMTVPSGELDFQNEVLTAAPHKETETSAGSFPIFNYGKSIHVTLEVEVAGKTRRLELDLQRRTKEELARYFSDGAARPYPWGARKVTQ
ncbi:hypothetical protein [Prosthecobacter sp.]|uniref:hypothetical protein n=1 Tax=Prosthecobacter sp. TaxID=1965333 RepID=UPI00378494A0